MRKRSMKMRLIIAGGLLTLFPLVAFNSLWWYESRRTEDVALRGTVELVNSDLKHVSDLIADRAGSYDQLLQQEVAVLLKVAASIGWRLGPPVTSGPEIEWKARNQFTKSEAITRLPRFHYGNTLLSSDRDPNVRAPFVDDVKDLTTATCTVFQRMNAAGDMLRVSTSVIGADGKRGTGTFIPAVNADGTPNAVVSQVSRGETFVGRAFVVDSWYVSAYAPLRSKTGDIIGMLYVGIPEKRATAYLQTMLAKMRFGSSGRVVAFNATGANRGQPIWPSERDTIRALAEERAAPGGTAESLMDLLCAKAVHLQPGAAEVFPYNAKGHLRTIRIVYYAPWDWVIGLDTAQEEVFASAMRIGEANQASQRMQIWAGIISVLAVAVAWWGIASQISGQLRGMTEKILEAARHVGFSTEHLIEQSRLLEESAQVQVGALARSSELGRSMSGKSQAVADSAGKAAVLMEYVRGATQRSDLQLREMMESMHAITGSSSRAAAIIKMIDEIALQTRMLALNAAIEAAHAGKAGRGFAVVAEQVGMTAKRCSEAAAETSRLIEECIDVSASGSSRLDSLTTGVLTMSGDLACVAEIVSSVAVMSSDQSGALRETARSLEDIGQATRQVDETSRSNAGAIEELSTQRKSLDIVIGEMQTLCVGERG